MYETGSPCRPRLEFGSDDNIKMDCKEVVSEDVD
jgi:hypothetical protein